ncbi:MAG: hypothetical protein MRECE_24c013 [Mycoplasmataceae bacterium CE_OT135]|nr:MAG: hypothetical protein MRECE_24c013 [Mycoplasmataceae bacterium CE_OT135]
MKRITLFIFKINDWVVFLTCFVKFSILLILCEIGSINLNFFRSFYLIWQTNMKKQLNQNEALTDRLTHIQAAKSTTRPKKTSS